MGLLKSIHHVAIIASDYEASKKFYTEVLVLQLNSEVYRKERQSYKADLFLNGVYVVELFSFPAPPARLSRPEATGLRHLAFSVDNIEETLAHFKALDIFFEPLRVDEYTGKKFTFIFDPDQLPIEIYET